MTSTVDSVIPLAGAADPTAFVNSANPSARSGISFADICAAQFPPAPESQATTPAPAVPSNLSPQTATMTAPSNTPGAKGTTKNPPPAGSNPALSFLATLPPILLAIPVSALPSAPPEMAASLSLVDSTNQAGSGSDGTIQATTLTPAPGSTTAPDLAQGNTSAPNIATPIPSVPPAANPSPEASASASASAQDPWFLSSLVETNSAPSSSSSGSPSVLPNQIGAQTPTVENMLTGATDGLAPPQISAAHESIGLDAEMPSQAPVAASASEIPSFSPDAQPPLTLSDAEQASQAQTPAAQVSPAVVETLSPPAAPPENMTQVAATSSSQPAPTAPADQKAQPRSVMQPPSPLEQDTLRPSSIAGTFLASSATAKTLASRVVLQGLQPVPSAGTPVLAHASPSSAPTIPAAANIQTANLQTMSTAENSLAVPVKSSPAPHQPGNAPVSTPGAQDPAGSAASPSKNDSGGDSSDSLQHKNSPNAAAATADSLPTAPSPAFMVAAPSAQANVPQPSSLPDAGPKSNPQTPAGVPDNAPRSSLPATADAPPTAASPLQWAQIANQAGHAEMRIGLNTTEFGSVEVRTTIHANDVGVQIGSEKGDLRSLLTPELPGIASTLQQQDLRVTQVSFHQQGFAFANNSSSFSGGNSQPRSFDWRPQTTVASFEESSSAEPAQAPEPAVSQRHIGLSILA